MANNNQFQDSDSGVTQDVFAAAAVLALMQLQGRLDEIEAARQNDQMERDAAEQRWRQVFVLDRRRQRINAWRNFTLTSQFNYAHARTGIWTIPQTRIAARLNRRALRAGRRRAEVTFEYYSRALDMVTLARARDANDRFNAERDLILNQMQTLQGLAGQDTVITATEARPSTGEAGDDQASGENADEEG